MDSQMRHARTGNHSTKEAATGRVKLMPAWALEPEEYYNTLRLQYDILVAHLHDLHEQIRPYTDTLKRNLPFTEYEAVKEIHSGFGQAIQIIQNELHALAPVVWAADHAARDAISFHLARRYLDFDTQQKIRAEADALVKAWRVLPPLRKPLSELPPEKAAEVRKKSHKRENRALSRDVRKYRPQDYAFKAVEADSRRDLQRRDAEHASRVCNVQKAEKQVAAALLATREELQRLSDHFNKGRRQ